MKELIRKTLHVHRAELEENGTTGLLLKYPHYKNGDMVDNNGTLKPFVT